MIIFNWLAINDWVIWLHIYKNSHYIISFGIFMGLENK